MRNRILFYAVSTQLGGAERSLLELVTELKHSSDEFEPWVVLPASRGPLIDALAQAGIAYEIVEMPSSLLKLSRLTPVRSIIAGIAAAVEIPRYLHRLRSAVQRVRPSLIHTTGIKCHLLGIWLGRAVGIPVLWHIRDIIERGWSRRSLRFFARTCGVNAIHNSHASMTALALPAPAESKVRTVVYNGLSPDAYGERRTWKLHDELGIDRGVPLVGILGVLARWKGQMEFIRMAGELSRRGHACHFAVIGAQIYDTNGDRGYEAELRGEAKRLGIEDKVHFLGFRRDSVDCINGLSVLVHASTRPEPFGRVVLEAMACAVPVVASNAGGIREFVDDEVNGLVFEPGDVDAMGRAVTRLLLDTRLRQSLVAGGRARFLEGFTLDRHRANFEKACRKILREA